MCGRYYRRSDKQRIAEAFQVGNLDSLTLELSPSYNVAPGTFQPVIRFGRDSGQREIALMWWGMVPYWAKDRKIGYSMINARCETLATHAAFREGLEKRRCLVPADGFYEWKKLDAKTKQPFAITLKSGEMLAFAGIWEHWKDRESGERLESFSIITTDPNELISEMALHDRMPAILKPMDYQRWLGRSSPQQPPIDLLRPFDADLMTAWRVDARVGNVNNDDPDLLKEAAVEPKQTSLFL